MVCAEQRCWPVITVVKKGGKPSKGMAEVNPLQAPASKLPARYSFALRLLGTSPGLLLKQREVPCQQASLLMLHRQEEMLLGTQETQP